MNSPAGINRNFILMLSVIFTGFPSFFAIAFCRAAAFAIAAFTAALPDPECS
ncbi:MAG: hypothetical protein ACQESR_26865 [Planctomycetota bacterium]